MFSFKYLYFVIFTVIVWRINAEISDKRMCIDALCSEPISDGKTLRRYNSIEPNRLSFLPNQHVRVFSYGAGIHPELLGVEINGKRGYVDKQFIRETKLLKRPKLLVDTELKVPSSQEIVPDKTQSDFDIVDGTKIPLDLVDLTPSEDVVQSTARTPPLETKVDGPIDDEDDEDDDDEEDDDEDDEEESVEIEVEVEKENVTEQLPVTETKPVTEVEVEVEKENITEQLLVTETKPVTTDTPYNPEVLPIFDEVAVTPNPADLKVEKTLSADSLHEDVVNNSSVPLDKGPQSIQEPPSQNIVSDVPSQIDIPESIVPEPSAKLLTEPPQNIVPDLPLQNIKPVVQPQNVNSDEPPRNIVPDLPSQNTVSEEPPKFVPEVPLQNIIPEARPQIVNLDQPLRNMVPEVPLQTNTVLGEPPKLVPEVPLQNIIPQAPPQNVDSDERLRNIVSDVPIQKSTVFEEPSEVPLQNITTEALPQNINFDEPLVNVVPDAPQKLVSEDPLQKIADPDLPLQDTIPEKSFQIPENVESTIENDEPKQEPARQSGFFGLGGLFNSNLEDPVAQPLTEVIEPSTGTLDIVEQTTGIPEIVPQVVEQTTGIPEVVEQKWFDESIEPTSANDVKDKEGGFFSYIMSYFSSAVEEPQAVDVQTGDISTEEVVFDQFKVDDGLGQCDSAVESCGLTVGVNQENESKSEATLNFLSQEILLESFNSDIFVYLVTTALSVIILIFIWTLMDKCRREQPLIARINKLEQQLLATYKENEILQEKSTNPAETEIPSELHNQLLSQIEELTLSKTTLEEQIQALEKELDMSTEVGIELNKMISEMLQSEDGREILKENVEQMQKKLLDQQSLIDSLNESVCLKETENFEVRLELEVSVKKVADLQGEVDKMVDKILKIEEEKTLQQKNLEKELQLYQNKCQDALNQEHVLRNEINTLKQKVAELQRLADTKIKEYTTLKETLSSIKSLKNDKETLKSFLDSSEIRAQLEQMKSENLKYSEQLRTEREQNVAYATQLQNTAHELKEFKGKYENADKEKVEISTKLEVLNNYFKEKEDQMQKEISKYESLWAVKEGEATSTTERVRLLQEELQNYKTQNESLRQEIVNQEVELRSQISMLEKKSHENWVTTRQTERRLEEARQEAALLRNRLTLRERSLQSPIQNGNHPLSPPPLESPPPIFNPRDMAKSSPIPGLPPPPPFLPHLGSAPFIPLPPLEGMLPPPLDGMPPPPFMPFPVDHRPPPLGGRYSPESTAYSEYDRYSPPYDSEYGASPPPMRAYSPYNDRRQPKSNGRSSKGMYSSGSENDSLGKRNKKGQRKV